ncbi:MAG: hypothetical protein M3007_02605 [Candidatus Eremiobacteraeota bacterium]|nr:hypothetical protein [Candidatus Eremiobacteraeota bacterium]
MFHLDDGTLRRLLDEPQSTLSFAQAHYDQCELCRQRAAELGATAEAVAQAYARAGAGTAREATGQPELSQALARTRLRLNEEAAFHIGAGRERRHRSPLTVALAALASAAAVVLLFLFTPLGTVAQGFLTIFEPHQFQAVAISPLDRSSMRYLPDLDAYGTVRELARPRSLLVSGPAQAAVVTRMPLRVPGGLPSNVHGPVHWRVMSPENVMFTFSASKTAASAAARHQALPPMPLGLDGSTLQIIAGPIVTTTFGGDIAPSKRPRHDSDDYPELIIVQAPLPRVQSTRASVRQIEDYVLRQPGIPPRLAAQIRAISDPTSTLPIPVPIDKASSQQVIVQGVRGLAVGDNTGVGAGVIWQRDGYIYGVAGPFPESEVLIIANSLR